MHHTHNEHQGQPWGRFLKKCSPAFTAVSSEAHPKGTAKDTHPTRALVQPPQVPEMLEKSAELLAPGHEAGPFRSAARKLLRLPFLPPLLQLLNHRADPQDQQGTAVDHRVAGSRVHILALWKVSADAPLLLGLGGLIIRLCPQPAIYSLSVSAAGYFSG